MHATRPLLMIFTYSLHNHPAQWRIRDPYLWLEVNYLLFLSSFPFFFSSFFLPSASPLPFPPLPLFFFSLPHLLPFSSFILFFFPPPSFLHCFLMRWEAAAPLRPTIDPAHTTKKKKPGFGNGRGQRDRIRKGGANMHPIANRAVISMWRKHERDYKGVRHKNIKTL
jgi:hypothetical protein